MAGIHRQRPGAADLAVATGDPAVGLGDGVWMSPGVSNSYAIATDDGRVIVNGGLFFEGVQRRKAFADVPGPTQAIVVTQGHADEASLATWAPAVDIYETENELVIKADLPDVNEKDLDVRVENNMLTLRGERKFEQKVKEENYLRIERSYGSFSRSFSLPNTVNTETIKAEYKNGALTVELPKRAETKPRQVKVNVTGSNN